MPAAIWVLTALLVAITSILPRTTLRRLIERSYGVRSPSAALVMYDLISNPSIASAALWLTPDEGRRIDKLDERFVSSYADRLSFYYAAGETDGWVRDSSVVEIAGLLERSLADRSAEERQLRRRRVHRCALTHSRTLRKPR